MQLQWGMSLAHGKASVALCLLRYSYLTNLHFTFQIPLYQKLKLVSIELNLAMSIWCLLLLQLRLVDNQCCFFPFVRVFPFLHGLCQIYIGEFLLKACMFEILSLILNQIFWNWDEGCRFVVFHLFFFLFIVMLFRLIFLIILLSDDYKLRLWFIISDLVIAARVYAHFAQTSSCCNKGVVSCRWHGFPMGWDLGSRYHARLRWRWNRHVLPDKIAAENVCR